MKLKLYILKDGLKEFVLMETAEFIAFEPPPSQVVRFYPRQGCSIFECYKIVVVPEGYVAEISED